VKMSLSSQLRHSLTAQRRFGKWRLSLLAGPYLCLALALSTGVAHAEPPKLIPDGQFEAEGATGVAVDNSAGESRDDVYVAGSAIFTTNPFGLTEGRVNKFDPSGGLVAPPSPFGEAVYYSGTAVNPVNGDVYALGATEFSGEPFLFTYDPSSGAPAGEPFAVPGSTNFGFLSALTTVVGIASDAAGNVYVPVVPKTEACGSPPTSCVLKYSPTGELLQTFTGGAEAGALKAPTGVAVDSSGDVWVADAGNDRIVELSPSGGFDHEIASEGVQSIAVDGHGDVFAIVRNSADFCGKLVAPCPHLVEYDSSGAQVADIGTGTIGAEAVKESTQTHLPDMVAVSDSTGRVYVTEGIPLPQSAGQTVAHSRVLRFTPAVAPTLEGEVASEVGVTEAKLGAVVDPGGVSASYRFEYGTTSSYGTSVPSPEGDTGGGFTSRTVWAAAKGLAPGTAYHYRVVVTSELGGALVGQDKTFTTRTTAQAGCPNEQFRTGFSATLPDCRAYELVTPPNEMSTQPDPFETGVKSLFISNVAAADGNRMAFRARDIFPGSPSGGQSYVATRGAAGWASENTYPPQNYYGTVECSGATLVSVYSSDLSSGIIQLDGGSPCGGPEPELVPGEPKGVINLYLRDNTSDAYQLINLPPPGVTGASAELIAASADLGHVLFREQAQLTPDAPAGVANLYGWNSGTLRLLMTLLPDGTPVAGALASPAISRDGSRIFFTYGGGLYAQSAAGTVQLDASRGGLGAGGGSLASVSADGSQVFFLDVNKLTADSTAETGKPDVYRYNFADREGERLSDLTVDSGEAANVQSVRGVGEDGSYVYFEAAGVLPGSVANGNGETAQSGQPNLYVWHDGGTAFIAKPAAGGLEVSANGAFLALASTKRLTGYDNTDANTAEPDSEIYLYSVGANILVCASCNPSGQRPTSATSLEARVPRNVADSGQVFFDSSETLLPADTNGQIDVYEFEPAGAGSCGDPAGCLSLLSTGTGARPTRFIDASASGSDVFLLGYQKLVPQDKQEDARVIYDVRAGGGIPEPSPPPGCATADACRTAPAPQPAIFGAPASQTFFGAGNLLAPAPALNPPAKPKPKPKKCKKGYVKNKKGKCVKAKKAKKGKRAGRTNGRGGK
jgi:hypothetical protein